MVCVSRWEPVTTGRGQFTTVNFCVGVGNANGFLVYVFTMFTKERFHRAFRGFTRCQL